MHSLPPDEDEAKIAQQLSCHLARFATIQNVKIIHDNKGGVCAFVQCEVRITDIVFAPALLICFRLHGD